MKLAIYYKDAILSIFLAVCISFIVLMVSMGRFGERSLGVLETIHGIPYPSIHESIVILEDMAHADLFLKEPVFAKQVKLTIAFDPGNSRAIDIGIRENEFWLSYVKYPLYKKGIDPSGFQTKEIIVPLSTALQDTDRSVDVMFFTQATEGNVEWRIQAFRASLEFDMPTYQEAKAYAKSILTRERAL